MLAATTKLVSGVLEQRYKNTDNPPPSRRFFPPSTLGVTVPYDSRLLHFTAAGRSKIITGSTRIISVVNKISYRFWYNAGNDIYLGEGRGEFRYRMFFAGNNVSLTSEKQNT